MTAGGASDAELLTDALGALLTRRCPPAAVRAAEVAGWDADLWTAVAEMGVPWIGIDDAAGGSGGTVATALAAIRTAGRHACPLPIAETGILAGWLLTALGGALPDGPLTVAPPAHAELSLDGTRLRGRAEHVPWAARADLVVAVCDDVVVALPERAFTVQPFRNLAGEPRETIEVDGAVNVLAPVGRSAAAMAEELELRGALARTAAIVGGLEHVATLTIEYANDRVQFGKRISSFQAVASHLVRMASEVQLAVTALDTVVARIDDAGVTALAFEIACAKAIAGRAATTASAAAHQVHGAIGMTQEHELQLFTRRLWAWREEFGTTREWERRASAAVIDAGAGGLWELLAI